MGWWARLFGASKDGKIAFQGRLSVKVIRANPSRWQRLLDKLKGIA